MAFMKVETSETRPNFLGSEVGLIKKTYEIKQAGVTANASGRKIVKGGTIYPANDATAVGIVFEDIDVTEDAVCPGSIIIAGRILQNRLPVEPAEEALTALKARGIYFDDEAETVRDGEA